VGVEELVNRSWDFGLLLGQMRKGLRYELNVRFKNWGPDFGVEGKDNFQ
jgi:hypothetical protein